MRHNIGYSFVYTYAKSLDQVSNGDYADGAANQTNPANNAVVAGPIRLRHEASHRSHRAVADTDVPYTTTPLPTRWSTVSRSTARIPGTQGCPGRQSPRTCRRCPLQNGAATQNVVRPIGYNGQAGTSCSNSAPACGSNFPNRTQRERRMWETAASSAIHSTPTGVYKPGIAAIASAVRATRMWDMSLAKGICALTSAITIIFSASGQHIQRLQPAASAAPGNDNGNNIANQYFGYAQGADSGRNIELVGRIQF